MHADDRSDEMPYAGIASYNKAPYVPTPSSDDGDVAVLGVPYDGGTSSRSGVGRSSRSGSPLGTRWAGRVRVGRGVRTWP